MTQVRVHLGEGTKVTLRARNHLWTADEPHDLGGTDEGPNPYELLLGSLGACTAITLRLYARHKGIELRSVNVEYSLEKVHAKDCAECEQQGSTGKLDVIRAAVRLEGDLTDEQRARLEQIVARCPVHKTLASQVEMFEDVDFTS